MVSSVCCEVGTLLKVHCVLAVFQEATPMHLGYEMAALAL